MFRFSILFGLVMSSSAARADLFNTLPQPDIRCASYQTDGTGYNIDITLFGNSPLGGSYYFQQPAGQRDIEYETFYDFDDGQYTSAEKATMTAGYSYQDGSFDITVNGAGGGANSKQRVYGTFRCRKGERPKQPFYDTMTDGRSLKALIQENERLTQEAQDKQKRKQSERQQMQDLLNTKGCIINKSTIFDSPKEGAILITPNSSGRNYDWHSKNGWSSVLRVPLGSKVQGVETAPDEGKAINSLDFYSLPTRVKVKVVELKQCQVNRWWLNLTPAQDLLHEGPRKCAKIDAVGWVDWEDLKCD